MNKGGFIGGGQVGYNYQFNNNFVAGVEADIQGLTGSGSGTSTGLGPGPTGVQAVTTAQINQSLDYIGTIRGRIGYLVTPTLLIYGAGGLAYGGANLSASYNSVDIAGIAPPGFGSSSYSDTRVGFAAGAGGEWMFAPHWSAKLEYLYYDLGSVTAPQNAIFGVNAAGALNWGFLPSTSARFNGHIVRVGLNYHFNWAAPSPVLAKY